MALRAPAVRWSLVVLEVNTPRDTLYGSAKWADDAEITAAGLHRAGGLYFGETVVGNPLLIGGDMPLITFAGSGSGKGRDVILHNILAHKGHFFVTDPKGELAAVSLHSLHLQGKHGFCINPFNLHPSAPWFLPSHRVNPLDILKPDSASLAADCKLIMEMMIPKAQGGDSYWTDKPREWGQVVLLWMVRRYGSVTLPEFYKLFSSVYADLTAWKAICGEMRTFPNPDVQRVVGEMVTKRKEAPKEFSGILGALFNGLSFIGDEALNRCLDTPDFSLSVVTSDFQPVNVYLIFPSEFMGMYAPFLRLIIGVSMLYKSRAPASPPVVFLIDEAAQLGYFEALQRCYGIGRGAGVRTWAFFQSIGDIEGHYGLEGAKTMMSSSQLRQFFGVRDLETARVLSEMVGQATIFYDDPERQEQHKMQAATILTQTIPNHDLGAITQAAIHVKMAKQPSIAGRALITADEVLKLPPNEQIAFIGDQALSPIRAKRRHYYERADLAGRYLPNPFHPPYDQTFVTHGRGSDLFPVVSAAVSDDLAALPQYQQGKMSSIKLPFSLPAPSRPFWKRLFGF
jgi:type IV secretion system protein VirD4